MIEDDEGKPAALGHRRKQIPAGSVRELSESLRLLYARFPQIQQATLGGGEHQPAIVTGPRGLGLRFGQQHGNAARRRKAPDR